MSIFLRLGHLQDGLLEDNYLDINTVKKCKRLRNYSNLKMRIVTCNTGK